MSEPTSPPSPSGASGRSAPASSGPSSSVASVPPLPLIFSITVTGILSTTLVGPAIPDILHGFHQPDSRAGLFVAAGTLPGIVMAPVIGVLADRYGRRAVLTPCLIAFGVFGLLSGLAPTFGLLLGFRLLQGIGSAGLINLAVVLIGDHWDGIERARLVGQNAAVLTVSLAVLPPLGGLLTELGGWRLAFTPYGLSLATALLIWRRLPPARPDRTASVRSQLGGARAAARDRDVLGSISIGFVIFVLIFGLFLTTLPLHLEREFGLDAGLRGLVIATPALTSTIAALLLGRLRLRFGAVAMISGAACLFTVAFAVIGAAGSLPVLIGGALLYGIGEGMVIPTLQDVVAGAAPASQRGAVVAMWVGAARAGQTVGPLAAAGIYGAVGTGTTFVIGGALASSLVVAELAGRFGDDRVSSPHPAPA